MSANDIRADVLVVGCGIAGATAALEAAAAGLRVVVVTKDARAEESNTFYAQGGIVSFAPDDQPELLKEDVLEAGDQIGDPAAVDILVADGPRLVQETLVDKLRIPFTRSSPDSLDYALEAGHSRRRILHVKDATGRTIEERFLRALRKHPRVTLLAGRTAVDLLTVPHHSKNPVAYYREPRAIGAYVLENATGEVGRVFAPFTVLATGGCGAVYLHTCNPPGADGSGYAMALRAGARIGNMEYIQFHPTVYMRENGDGFLISEAVRGEGARLKTRDGRTFMHKYSPQRELAPRDEVSRAIYEEMIVTNTSHVLLDLASYAGPAAIRERFPTILKTCLEDGLDITRAPIPVVPAAHYCCGGVLADGQGRTSLAGLYAVGEVACTGVHGANRLASTSLLEGLVLGHAGRPGHRGPLRRLAAVQGLRDPPLAPPDGGGADRPGPDQPGLADHPLDDVELRRHHPDPPPPGAGQGRPRLPPPPHRAVLPVGPRRAGHRRPAPRHPRRPDDHPGGAGQSLLPRRALH